MRRVEGGRRWRWVSAWVDGERVAAMIVRMPKAVGRPGLFRGRRRRSRLDPGHPESISNWTLTIIIWLDLNQILIGLAVG
jgi:hypothetical protein